MYIIHVQHHTKKTQSVSSSNLTKKETGDLTTFHVNHVHMYVRTLVPETNLQRASKKLNRRCAHNKLDPVHTATFLFICT